MATRFVTNLDLVQNQILNGRFEQVSADPTTGNFEGRLIYNSTEKTIKVYTGSAWRKMLHGISVTGASNSAITISEANGSVTVTPNRVSQIADGVMWFEDKLKLDNATNEATANTLALRDAGGRLRVATPQDGLDAANKSYVDSARTGLDVKASVKVATVAEGAFSTSFAAGQEIDDYTLVAGDRILIKNQSNEAQNGIYVVNESGAPSRADDASENYEVTTGMFTFVEQGTLNADSGWVLITDGPINVGTSPLEFSLFSVAGNILAGAGLSKTGDVLDVNVDEVGIEIHNDTLRIASGAAGDSLGWDDGVLNLKVAANGGMEIASDELQIKIDPDFVGLETTSNGIRLTANIAGDALSFTDGELDVVVSANGGLEIVSDELQINIDEDVAGLTTTADGLALASNIAGDGLTFTDGVLSRDVIDLGEGSDDTTGTLPVDQGGTGATTESQARDTLALTTAGFDTSTPRLARIASKVIGDASATSFTVTHNFNTKAVIVQVFDSTTNDTVIADVIRSNVNYVTVAFSVAPALGAYTVVVTG